MSLKRISILLAALVVAATLVPFALIETPALAHPPLDATPIGPDLLDPKYLNRNSCPDDPKNLALNGGFFPDLHDTPYGPVVNPWQPFIFSGSPPQFRWVNNEGIFRGQSEQLFSTGAFDAGIMQTVQGLQPGSYYWFRLGWAPAAKSFNGPNDPSSSVGVKVGVDPYGGTDPTSPNVIWGADLFGDNKALNRPQLTMIFAAQASSATIFLRAMARDGSGGENRVWFNAVCMEARPEMGTATPLAPTATPVPPTSTPRPLPTRAPATRTLASPTRTPTPPEAALAPDTPTVIATQVAALLPTGEPRFARPEPTPAPSLPIEPGQGAMAGLGTVLMLGGILSFGTGIFLWRRID
jgi:hypothetical protein